MNDLEKIIGEVLAECDYAGTFGDAGVAGYSTAFSGDNYAPNDNRVPKVLGSVITRNGQIKPEKRKKRQKKVNIAIKKTV